MDRVYFPYWEWEDFCCGMWTPTYGEERFAKLREAIDFTGNAELYGQWMLTVGDAWPIASMQNLTNISQNRKAWIGHAAAFLAIQSTEDVTREAWCYLTQQQQDDANRKAQEAIDEWESKYEGKNTQVRLGLGS